MAEDKMKLGISLIGCVVLLGGCDTLNLSKPDPSIQKFNADWEECQKENPPENENAGIIGESKARQCMRAKGYADANKKQ